jgi:hypothetical protein
LKPSASEINAYGYYGTPSTTAHTPYDKLLFTVFAIKKENSEGCNIKLNFPLEVLL